MSKKSKLTEVIAQQEAQVAQIKTKKPYVKKKDRTESKLKIAKKKAKHIGKKFTERKFLTKLIIVVSSVALLGTSVLPYLVR